MKNWTVKAQRGANFEINGENIIDAIEKNFTTIAGQAELGNAAGYRLNFVSAQYQKGILGGKGGVVLTIDHSGAPLANGKPIETSANRVVWIYANADDLQGIHNFVLK